MNIPTDTLSILFGLLLALVGIILWRMQRVKDTFDLRDIICEWVDGVQIVSTNKSLLTGAFAASSYYMLKHPSEMVFTAYLTAWVTNTGISAWRKVQEAKQ